MHPHSFFVSADALVFVRCQIRTGQLAGERVMTVEWFMMMVAPELVVAGAVLFLFIYAWKYKDRAE
ncbi:hypothetical protein HMSSN139_52570 [Paenibacillus sp. HMSSN-139]|nr:hypothetical protein HMSSN139_52570 [Paenibacillus sp. HMSSN-139]